MDSQLFDRYLRLLEEQSTVPDLIGAFDDIIGGIGGIGFVAAAWRADDASQILLYASQKEPFTYLDAESAWWADDPIVPRLANGAVRPFSYEEAWVDPLPTAAERWDALVAAGLDRGIVYPTSRPPYIGSLLVFGAQTGDSIKKLTGHNSTLHLLATYFHGFIVDHAPGEDVPGIIRNTLTPEGVEGRRSKLSGRELDCLRWLALGKSASDIAAIENLSVHTVRSYLRTGMRKLGASTQAQAIAHALKYGLIKV